MPKNIFPDWHNKPLSLNIDEIEHPEIVIDDFCSEYTIIEFRGLLWSWLIDALQNENANAGMLILLFERILKLTEAIYLIQDKHKIQ